MGAQRMSEVLRGQKFTIAMENWCRQSEAAERWHRELLWRAFEHDDPCDSWPLELFSDGTVWIRWET
jgi:hypothetical protein